jgi:hypothetical protein
LSQDLTRDLLIRPDDALVRPNRGITGATLNRPNRGID